MSPRLARLCTLLAGLCFGIIIYALIQSAFGINEDTFHRFVWVFVIVAMIGVLLWRLSEDTTSSR